MFKIIRSILIFKYSIQPKPLISFLRKPNLIVNLVGFKFSSYITQINVIQFKLFEPSKKLMKLNPNPSINTHKRYTAS